MDASRSNMSATFCGSVIIRPRPQRHVNATFVDSFYSTGFLPGGDSADTTSRHLRACEVSRFANHRSTGARECGRAALGLHSVWTVPHDR